MTIFKSLGMAIEDVVAAELAVRRAPSGAGVGRDRHPMKTAALALLLTFMPRTT